MTVSTESFVAMSVTLFLCIALPVGLFLIVRRRTPRLVGPFIGGMLAFYISQMLIRVPLLQMVLPRFSWYQTLSTEHILWFVLLLSLSAGLFEETARLLVFKWVLKERRTWHAGVAFGIGHGGVEAVLLVGMTYVNNLILSSQLNRGTLFSSLEGHVDPETMNAIAVALVQTPPDLFLAAGVERALVLVIHIALTLVVLEGIVRKQSALYWGIAVLGHTMVNAVSVGISRLPVNHWWAEAAIAVFAALGGWYILTSRRRFGNAEEPEDEGEQALKEGY